MHYDKYESLIRSTDAQQFKFTSIGPKGEIAKVVQFTQDDRTGIYHLTFGNLMANGEIDDTDISNNGDRNKILATIANAIYQFTVHYPDKYVFFSGSTSGRTRLYRMAISVNFETLYKDFNIIGLLAKGDRYHKEPFRKGKCYDAFLIIKN